MLPSRFTKMVWCLSGQTFESQLTYAVADGEGEVSWFAHEPSSRRSIFEYRGVSVGNPVSPPFPSTQSVSPPPLSLSPASPHMSPALSELDSVPIYREIDPIAASRARALELERMTGSQRESCTEIGYNETARSSRGCETDPNIYPNRWPKYSGS